VGCGGAIGGDIALDSLTARLEFWTNSSFVWLSSPLWGHGFGSFNFQYPRFDSVHLLLFPSMGHTMGATNFAGAAHNEYLQVLCELGAIGLILSLRVVWRPWKPGPATVCLGLAMIESLIEFPLQNPATALLASISLGFFLRSQSAASGYKSGRDRRISAWLSRRFGPAMGPMTVRSNPTRR